jgi:4-amino-4-deoxy-L-arabinose transferase-like glycosyltransferase
MPIQPTGKQRIIRLTWIFVSLGVAIILISFIPFKWITTFLGQLEADGTFDSLKPTQFATLIWVVRGFGGLSLILASGIMIVRKMWANKYEAALESVPRINIREDLQAFGSALRGGDDQAAFWLTIAGLTFLAILIRAALIEYPVRYDEAYTFIKFSSRPVRYILTDYSAPNNHILHSLLVHWSYQIFGMELWALRLPAFLAGVLSVISAALAGRKLYGPTAGILAAAGLALSPLMIDYSVNARGYTLICLFALLGLWAAAEIIQRSRFLWWVFLVLVCAMGFYSIPIFLYPAGILFLWLGVSSLAGNSGGISRGQFLLRWFAAGIFLGLVVFLLYLPVLFFGTGLQSITSNEFVQSLSWSDFVPTLVSRVRRVWETWNSRVPDWITILSVIGFILHLLFFRRNRNHRIPVVAAAFVWISLSLAIQRVTPLPRMWIFLLGFYLLWSAAGWCALAAWLFRRKVISKRVAPVLFAIILLVTWVGYRIYLQDSPIQDSEDSFNEQAANYITAHIPENTGLVGVSPTTIQVSYYLRKNGIDWDRFYDRDRPQPITHAWVVVVEKSRFPTVEDVLAFQGLDDDLDPTSAKPVFTFKRLTIYDVTE